jgi:hypothetical protein
MTPKESTMTAAAPTEPIVYGHDASGRPAAIDLTGPCPHVLISGGAGQGLTTLVGVIAHQAARQGLLVRACQPKLAGHDAQPSASLPSPELAGALDLAETIQMISEARAGIRERHAAMALGGVPDRIPAEPVVYGHDASGRPAAGLIAASGLKETTWLIRQAHTEMYRRCAAIEQGTARRAGLVPLLLIIDDFNHLMVRGLSPDDRREAAVTVTALEEIVAFGRVARVSLVIAAHVMPGLRPGMLDGLGTRIVLGPVTRATALRLPGDAEAGQLVPDVPGAGMAASDGGQPVEIRVLGVALS